MKNIDYEPPTTSSCSSSFCSSEEDLRTTHSLDLPSFGDRTSFRIDGSDVGQLNVICHSLGLESPDDFGIPMASWEARKIRSTSNLLPGPHFKFQFDHSHDVAETVKSRRSQTNCFSEIPDAVETIGNGPFRGDCFAVDDSYSVTEVATACDRVGNGIRGVRPPPLSTPLSFNLKPLIHNAAGSKWDILKSLDYCNQQDFSSYGEEEADMDNGRSRLGETVSSDCSFTTSNEDDSSSITTEPSRSISPNGYGLNISPNRRFRPIVIVHWQKGELLGRGSFGSVYEGICDGGFFIAVKEVSLLDQGEQGRQSVLQLEQEIALLSQFEHENIVRYLGTDKDESKLYIFLELVTRGSLLSLYQKYHLRDSQVSAYTRQILHGLKYLHDRGVVHRDIKCANILVDANGLVKLADFGLAKATKFNDVRSCKGTAFWMAPEVVNQRSQGYGIAADIWSLGCTVLEMLTRQLPYSPLECIPALFRIGRNIPPPVPDSLSGEARDFIFQCLKVDPSDRPTAVQLLDHPFVKKPLSLFSGLPPWSPGDSRVRVVE